MTMRRAGRSNLAQVPAGEDLAFAEMRLAGLTLAAIAESRGVSISSVHKTLQRPHVQAWLTDRQRDAAEAARLRIAAMTDRAVAVVGDLAWNADGETPHAVRLAAAKELLARAVGPVVARTEVSGPEGGPIQIEAIREQVRAAVRQLQPADLSLPELPDGG